MEKYCIFEPNTKETSTHHPISKNARHDDNDDVNHIVYFSPCTGVRVRACALMRVRARQISAMNSASFGVISGLKSRFEIWKILKNTIAYNIVKR